MRHLIRLYYLLTLISIENKINTKKSTQDTPKIGNGLFQFLRMDGFAQQIWVKDVYVTLIFQDPKRHLEEHVDVLMASNIVQCLGAMLHTVVFKWYYRTYRCHQMMPISDSQCIKSQEMQLPGYLMNKKDGSSHLERLVSDPSTCMHSHPAGPCVNLPLQFILNQCALDVSGKNFL